VKSLYDTLALLRSVKQQAADSARKSPAVSDASKTLVDKLVAIEGDITQRQGEGGQDALNFPGRLDNQWVVLYGEVVSLERKLNKAVLERYADLKPTTDQLMQRATNALKNDVAAFNSEASKAGATLIVVGTKASYDP
jgi:hypothetical protein